MAYIGILLAGFGLGLLARREPSGITQSLVERLQLGRVREERGRWA